MNKEAVGIARHNLEGRIYMTDKLEDKEERIDEDVVLKHVDKEGAPEVEDIGQETNKEATEIARRALEDAKMGGEEMTSEREADRTQRIEIWREWLEDDWYGEVVSYLLFGQSDKITEKRLRRIQREAEKFVLTNIDLLQP